jgi:hypothetical protein
MEWKMKNATNYLREKGKKQRMIDQEALNDLRLYLNKTSSKILLVEDESQKILSAIIDRDSNIHANKAFFFRNASACREELLHIEKDIDECNAKLTMLGSLFRGTLKQDKFTKFTGIIDSIPFEFYLNEKEARTVLKKY